jgi:hypothetical protein
VSKILLEQAVLATGRANRKRIYAFLGIVALGIAALAIMYDGNQHHVGEGWDGWRLAMIIPCGLTGSICIWGVIKIYLQEKTVLKIYAEEDGVKFVTTNRVTERIIQSPFRWFFWIGEVTMNSGSTRSMEVTVLNILLRTGDGAWMGFRTRIPRELTQSEWPFYHHPLKDAENVFQTKVNVDIWALLIENYIEGYHPNMDFVPYTGPVSR